MTVYVISTREEFARIQEDWDHLACSENRYFPSFIDVYEEIVGKSQPFRLIMARGEKGTEAIAFFSLANVRRSVWLGERKLLDIPVRQALLEGSAILGNPDTKLAAAVLNEILIDQEVTFVDLGDVDKRSGLYSATKTAHWKWLKHETDWRAVRRTIALPITFEHYLATLRPSTRKNALRDQRIFAKLNPDFRVMTRSDEMGDFLRDATCVGDKTYQSGFGMSLDTSEWRMRFFEKKAKSGRLCAYVAYIDGKPSAFAWGEISYGTFYFRMTGYDPALRKYCPGTSILLYVISDLIAGSKCSRFDFGLRDMEYKERFATTSVRCAKVIYGSWRQPTAILAVALGRLSCAARSFFLPLLGGRAGLQKLKKAMR